MKMQTFCFVLAMNEISPISFFESIPDTKMVELQKEIQKAETADDAQKILNKYERK